MTLAKSLVGFAVAVALSLAAGPLAALAQADESEAPTWHLEQPLPPELPNGQKATTPIGLGKIGDMEFWAPNRGLLITAGNPPTIPPGLWAYNGVQWHELSPECGATDGRIAWAGPEEFWTVSDGRPGQASETGQQPPLIDNTLCHFAGGEIVGSYASLAFLPSSYQPMNAAACVNPEDCWFGGEPLPEPKLQRGAFHLHWNGSSLTAEPNPQGHAVEDMRVYDGRLYESVRLSLSDLLTEPEPEPSDLHLIRPNGVQPSFLSLTPGVPVYAASEFPAALDFLHLSADEHTLWGAANPAPPVPGSTSAEVTIVRDSGGIWSQVLGPATDPPSGNPFTKFTTPEHEKENEVVNSIAAYPNSAGESTESESAWLALDTQGDAQDPSPTAAAVVARIFAHEDTSEPGTILGQQTLPSVQEADEGIGPKGAADKITCPGPDDCWMVTTQGWLFHLTTPAVRQAEENEPDTDPAFSKVITFRPHDAGIPAVVPDEPPADDSGLLGEIPPVATFLHETSTKASEPRITLPLLSALHTRLVHGTTLELRLRLAVKASIRLIAKRGKRVVASTPARTLAAGNRKLLLRLDRRRWPTKLQLQSHALAPLPTISTREAENGTVTTGEAGNDTVSTSLRVFPRTTPFAGLGPLG